MFHLALRQTESLVGSIVGLLGLALRLLDALALQCGVSCATIFKVERAVVGPIAIVRGKLAEGLKAWTDAAGR